MGSTTNDLIAIGNGDIEARRRLFDSMYEDFQRLAQSYLRGEQNRNQMSPTTLVHEAYIRLVDQERVDWRGRTHFFAIGAKIMRQLLVDHARNRQAQKRGGVWKRVHLDDTLTFNLQNDSEILELDELLQRLEKLDQRQAKIVELRFFGGMDMNEIAESMAISPKTIEREWLMVRAWLRSQLSANDSE